MQTVDREAFSQCVEDLQQTVGVVEARGDEVHSCIQGVMLTLDIAKAEHASPDEFCRLLKGAYIRNLFQISVNAMQELREIANTGKSDGLIQVTQLLDASFRKQENITPEQHEEAAGYGGEY